jgi:hypothetical protein
MMKEKILHNNTHTIDYETQRKQPVNQFTNYSDGSAFAPNEMLSQDKTSNWIRLRLKGMTTNLVGHNNQPKTKLFIP